MEIKCKKITCGFNESTICMAREITIDSCQGCQSFTQNSKQKEIKKNLKNNRFEVGNELCSHIHSPNKNVNCKTTNCKFNNNQKCMSNGITLSNEKFNALCVSHIDK